MQNYVAFLFAVGFIRKWFNSGPLEFYQKPELPSSPLLILPDYSRQAVIDRLFLGLKGWI